ncbi:MAG TPA: asparagine synthase-related protein [Nannocystaceae bacterium]|nr:asparagine synthase-related protein [Nannocystaceae bacterium]
MCGIAGIIGGDASETVLAAMLRAIAHRGDPDRQAEIAVQDGIAIGTNRLAIVDPAHGRQPFAACGGDVLCVCNGEIYNADALREELSDRFDFATRCDTEVVLAAWLAWREDLVHHLRGMYAFAIADRRTSTWVLARDPLGIKPLYVGDRDGTSYFASELKALAALGLAGYRTVDPGSVWIDGVRARVASLPVLGREGGVPVARIPAIVRRALQDAVRSHLPGRRERLACLLSGGIDSSTVLALASELHDGPLEAWTFSTGRDDSEDLRAARLVTAHLGVPLHVVQPTEAELTELYLRSGVAMTETWEPALVRNAVSYHFLCRAVRAAGHRLALSGEGADEVFGGYDYLRPLAADEREVAIRESLVDLHRTYLQMADRAAMFATLEVRVPFVDADTVRRCVALPPSARRCGDVDKWGLRQAATHALPAVIRARAKLGMNAGAGFGSNDPGEGIYFRAVGRHYEETPQARRRDERTTAPLVAAFGVDPSDREQLFCFARFVEHGYHRLEGAQRRPRLNVSPTANVRMLEVGS